MTQDTSPALPPPVATVELVERFAPGELHELCDAAEAAILDGGGFGWLTPPPREAMEAYWNGVLVVPERQLYAARLDGTMAGSGQLVLAPKANEAQARAGQITMNFVAPWARGHGLAPMLVKALEAGARKIGLEVLNLDIRETQARAIQVYELAGFTRWGSNPYYARVDGRWKFARRFLQPHYQGSQDLSAPFKCTAEALRERGVEGVDA